MVILTPRIYNDKASKVFGRDGHLYNVVYIYVIFLIMIIINNIIRYKLMINETNEISMNEIKCIK